MPPQNRGLPPVFDGSGETAPFKAAGDVVAHWKAKPMSHPAGNFDFALFVPANRTDRYAKAFAAGADAVIIDLEDAVAPADKWLARKALCNAREAIAAAPVAVLVRINAIGGDDYPLDLQALADLPIAGIVLPKAETADSLSAVAAATGLPVIALIESARGLAAARAIASACARLAFGSIDYASDMGCAHTRAALAAARSELVLASRLASLPAPIDGVTAAVRDTEKVRDDAAYALELGFGGKLLIHPDQIEPAIAGFSPAAETVAWAKRVLATDAGVAVHSVDGTMVDLPVRLLAERILLRNGRAAFYNPK